MSSPEHTIDLYTILNRWFARRKWHSSRRREAAKGERATLASGEEVLFLSSVFFRQAFPVAMDRILIRMREK